MKTYRITEPSVCGLVTNADGDLIISYLGRRDTICHTPDTSVFEEFTTRKDAAQRAGLIDEDFDTAMILNE